MYEVPSEKVRCLLSASMDVKAYTTPSYFRDDWLNQYYDMRAARESPLASQRATQ